MLKIMIWITLSFNLIACTKTIYKPVFIPVPVSPTFPAITKADHATCKKSVSNKFKKRDIIITGYCRTLEGVIKVNNKRAK